jgi:Holliday junction resolvase-like predicted endonuclease
MAGERSARAAAKLDKHQVGQAGEHFVAAELHRRGGYAVTFAGNMPGIDILASDVGRTRTVSIQVKTRTAGSWHTTTSRGRPRKEKRDESEFWIFVDVGRDPDVRPDFFVVPAWWMENSIHVEQRGARRSGNSKRYGLSARRGRPARQAGLAYVARRGAPSGGAPLSGLRAARASVFAIGAQRCVRSRDVSYATIVTGVPSGAWTASCSMMSFGTRTQPLEMFWPTCAGLLVPCTAN